MGIFILFALLLPVEVPAQLANITYSLRTDYVTSRETSACWEGGNEEYTAKVYANDESSGYAGSCLTCDYNGDCTYANDHVFKSRSNVNAYTTTLSLEAYENDSNPRCDHNGGDDCRWGTNYYSYDVREISYPSNGSWSNTSTYGNGNHTIAIQSTWRYAGTANQIYPCGDWQTAAASTGAIRSWTVNMEAGRTYSFSTCGAADDTYIRIYGSNGYTIVASNDDSGPHCGGTQSSIDFTPSSSGNYYLEVSRYTRSQLNNAFTLSYKMDAGDPATFGNNVWNVYAYNGRNRDNLGAITYGGYYTDNNLSINTGNFWGGSVSPSNASGYIGCPISNDNHTFVHKRRGFPCGVYNLNLTDHDDEVVVYVNGVSVFVNNGCCANHGTVWTGMLDASSTIEIRVAEGGGGSRLVVDLTDVTPTLTGGLVTSGQGICEGGDPAALNVASAPTGGTLAYTSPNYQWQVSTAGCASGFSNISGATGISYDPPAGITQNTYYRIEVTDDCGNIAYSNCLAINVSTNSTTPSIAAVSGEQCPNSTLSLTASGGVAGTSSNIRWYSGPNGTGTLLGTGASINVNPSTTTTYYVRREGVCNTTSDDTETVDVRSYAYTPVGSSTSVGYCTDNSGWHHFYDSNDDIIFSLTGDLSGATSAPVVTIENNGSYYQTTVGAVGACASGWSPGEEFFEMQRSWNVDFVGTLNPPYSVRYYFPASEKTAVENAAIAHMAANPTCNYGYKYSNPLGFYWFKNTGSAYNPPLYDQPTHLTGSSGTVAGVNYSEMTGVTSFSGGTGGVALSPDPDLPIELIDFTGWNENTINVLQWATASEINNALFEIERSIAPQDGFTKIGELAGAGNSTATINYQYKDNAPMLGVNYYRLRQIDFDGTYSYSKTIAIEVKTSDATQIFYPNPTSGELIYQYNSSVKETLKIEITDILGKKLAETTYNVAEGINTKTLDLTSYTAGTYIVVVKNKKNEVVATEKIIKNTP